MSTSRGQLTKIGGRKKRKVQEKREAGVHLICVQEPNHKRDTYRKKKKGKRLKEAGERGG